MKSAKDKQQDQIQTQPLSRRNGGPRTERGKANSSQNSLKLGLFASSVIVQTKWFTESPTEFRRLLRAHLSEYPARTTRDFIRVQDLTLTEWRLSRLLTIEKILMELHGSEHRKDRWMRVYYGLAGILRERGKFFNWDPTETEKRAQECIQIGKENLEPEETIDSPEEHERDLGQLLAAMEVVHQREVHLRPILRQLREELDSTLGGLPKG